MDVQIGMGCNDQALCDKLAMIFGYVFLALLVAFLGYVIYKVINNKK